MGLVAPIGLLVLLVPLCNPRIAVGLLVGLAILLEGSTPNVLHVTLDSFHDPLPGHYSVLELVMVLAICSVVVDASRRGRVPLRPAPFGPAIALLALAILSGVIVGHAAGEGFNGITEQARPIFPLIVVPWLVVNCIRDAAELRRAIGLIAILTAVKAVLGLIGVVTHEGAGGDGTTLTYYEPTANWLAMTYILTILASTAGRWPVDRIARWAAPVVLLCLAFSLRRSFWIGIAAAAPVTLLVAIAPRGRRFLLPVAIVLTAGIWIAVTSGIGFDSQTPIGQRIQSLSPSSLTANTQDRYRLDERKNVLAELRASPIVGLGLGVPWQERYPLSFEDPGARTYTHIAVLWFWLKLGVIGMLSYIGYLLTAFVVGIQVSRRHRDARVRAAGAGVAGGLIGLAVAETTATWLGTDLRMTVLIGCVVGLLSVARNQTRVRVASEDCARDPDKPRVRNQRRLRHPARRHAVQGAADLEYATHSEV